MNICSEGFPLWGGCTDKKENEISLTYKEIQMGAVEAIFKIISASKFILVGSIIKNFTWLPEFTIK
jgi:hypothetical protein